MASMDFYFDFSSSYSYLALPKLEKLQNEQGVDIKWMPVALGAIFKANKHPGPPAAGSPKLKYISRDIERIADMNGQSYFWPDPFPFNSITAARIYWYLEKDDPVQAIAWAKKVFNASFGEGRNCSDPEELSSLASHAGLDGSTLLLAAGEDSVKDKLKAVTGEAMGRGVFGAPTFFVGNEMFWGADRLDQAIRLL